MPEPHDEWVHTTLGRDPAAYAAAGAPSGAPGGAPGGAPSKGLDTDETLYAGIALGLKELDAQRKRLAAAGIDTTPLDIQIATFRSGVTQAKADPEDRRRHVTLENLRHNAQRAAILIGDDAEAQLGASGKGTGAAIGDLRNEAAKQIAHVPKGKARDILDQRLDFLDTWIKEAAAEKDPKRRAPAIENIDIEAQSLLKAAAKQTGDTKAVQAAFAAALQDKYGFAVTNPTGTPNTHLDRVYMMFEKVPMGHVAQGKLKELSYERTKEAGAVYGGAKITMGSYGAKPADWDYTDPEGGPHDSAQNGFDISALHELGHSVDDRWGIMDAHGGKAGCGSWQDESLDSVADAVTAAFLTSSEGMTFRPPQEVARSAIGVALEKGKAARPKHVADTDWKALDTVLKQCADMRDGKDPWERPKDFGGRTYHEAGPGSWVSCDFTKRQDTGITVRDYQWRSKAEFFAELYAFSWLNHKEPPGGIESALKPYMFRKKG